MRIRPATAIPLPAILLLSRTPISWANILKDIPKHNPLNIDWYPAPSPADGPPLSANASRDPALLPAQIGGILGAYLFSLCIVGLVLICIGRRLRAKIIQSAIPDIEMVHTPFHKNFTNFNESPISPGAITPSGARNFSWPSPDKDTRNPYVFPPNANRSPVTPTDGAYPYIDTRIVEADREMLDRDLEDLYAHVMEQEEAKAAGVKVSEMPLPSQLQRAPLPPRDRQKQESPAKKGDKARPGALNLNESNPPSKSTSRASSMLSALVSPRFGRKSVKPMQISSPLPTPMSSTFAKESNGSDEEPLAPRYYTPPPPPPVPTDQIPYTHSRQTSSAGPTSPTRSLGEAMSTQPQAPPPRKPATRHHQNPSQISVQTNLSHEPVSAASATSQTPLFPPPASRNKQQQASAGTPPTRALPFRQFEPALASPSATAGFTKTTVLERHERPSGPMTGGGLRTPWSAGAVPYSPYQPFSPMVPMTPRLVTKEDRKVMKRVQPKTPTMDLVTDERDLWDSGY